MPFCSKCGASLNDAFCAKCGNPSDLERKSGDENEPTEAAQGKPVNARADRAPGRPDSVRLAVILLYISVAVRVLTTPIAFSKAPAKSKDRCPARSKPC